MKSNVVDLIMSDHRELERLFVQLQTEPEKRPLLTPVMVALLTAHSRAEEAEVYPAAASAGIAEDVEHSQKEHLEADQLAAAVAAADPGGAGFDAKLEKLIHAVTHHIQEEESSVLPGMRTNLDADTLDKLGESFLASRGEHLGEMPEDITKADLEQQAANANVTGASSLSKQALAEKLKATAEECSHLAEAVPRSRARLG
ncbi:hemerythrin domain-containing protein [Marmoricola sp. RAF53]|uniref:hemerythrin domain-containing protein n=1 Tax=Marmoricola sp. RAF53 TaxID=3233059 RepID=UPI003F9693DC